MSFPYLIASILSDFFSLLYLILNISFLRKKDNEFIANKCDFPSWEISHSSGRRIAMKNRKA